ncbi:MAG: chloramphenicol acetyltransferase [Oscillospiraceae bacterium]|nr:chloramphenicol acetyltransferase [Oscillospiraceae bacterium]
MAFRWLDMDDFPRRAHFEYFSGLAYPYVGTTANVDITDALKRIKEEKLPFFLTICYCAVRAANGVPELRQRIKEGRIVEFDQCRVSHTVALEDETFCYCTLENEPDLAAYAAAGRKAQEAAKEKASIEEDPDESLDKFFVSSLPWLSYTALIQPVPSPADSNPRITFGKYFTQGERVLMPVTLLCNHALVDGRHIAAFYHGMERELAAVSAGPEGEA